MLNTYIGYSLATKVDEFYNSNPVEPDEDDFHTFKRIYNYYKSKNPKNIPPYLRDNFEFFVPTIEGKIAKIVNVYWMFYLFCYNKSSLGKLHPEHLVEIYKKEFDPHPTVEQILQISEDIEECLITKNKRNAFKKKYDGLIFKWDLLSIEENMVE